MKGRILNIVLVLVLATLPMAANAGWSEAQQVTDQPAPSQVEETPARRGLQEQPCDVHRERRPVGRRRALPGLGWAGWDHVAGRGCDLDHGAGAGGNK